MAETKTGSRPALRPLTKTEIDERLERLVDDVVANVDGGGSFRGSPGTDEPIRIDPAELVRRVRPFIVYN